VSGWIPRITAFCDAVEYVRPDALCAADSRDVVLDLSGLWMWRVGSPWRLRRGGSGIQEDQSAHAVGEICHADLHLRPCDADRSHDMAHDGFLVREDMLDGRTVGRIGPNGARQIVPVKQGLQSRAVMRRSACNRPIADQAVTPVDGDVVLVSEGRDCQIDLLSPVLVRFGLRCLQGLARVHVLLRQLGRLVFLSLRNVAFADRGFLRVRIALLGCGYNGRVDDLAAHGQKAHE
jgi:hypothetical protein